MKLLNDLKLQFEKELWALNPKLDERKPFSFKVFQKYISLISGETLNKMLVAINRIAIEEGIEDGRRVRSDSTAVETNIHYPANNSLIWDCIKTINRLLRKLKDSGVQIKVRSYKKQAKKTCYKINNTKSKDKRKEEFKKQLKLLRSSIKQAERALLVPQPCNIGGRIEFDAKVYWKVIVYNIRVMSRAFLAKMQTQMQ